MVGFGECGGSAWQGKCVDWEYRGGKRVRGPGKCRAQGAGRPMLWLARPLGLIVSGAERGQRSCCCAEQHVRPSIHDLCRAAREAQHI